MSSKIYLDAPSVGQSEKKYINNAIDNGYVSTMGPFVPEFENRLAEYLGVKSAVSTQSGTAAIHMALYELGIGEGDEVIVPALTFVATINPIVYVGAKPVFVDVDISTWNICPDAIKNSITENTKAMLPVHLYGNPCAMDEIMEIANKFNLYIIEDATESLGSKYKGNYTGTFGDMGCFSFNGNKIITTGGGGLIVGNNIQRLEHLKFLINQAKDETREYYHPEIGFNYRMTNIEAALGLAQIEKLENILEKKKVFNDIYKKELEGINSIRFQEEYKGSECSFWFSCILVEENINLPGLQKELKERKIPTRRIFMPATEMPPFQHCSQDKVKNSHRIYNRGLCLPSSILNSAEDIYYVCKTIKKLVINESLNVSL